MAQRGIDKTFMNKTMNELIPKQKDSKLYKSDSETGLLRPIQPKLVDANGNLNIQDDPTVKGSIDFNNQVEIIEHDYSKKAIEFTNGSILVRLFKKVPAYKGFLNTFTVPLMKQQGKTEIVPDPMHFSSIGVIVNYDPTYENRSVVSGTPCRFAVGDIVQVDIREAMTLIQENGGQRTMPMLKSMYLRYDETRRFEDLGYITITSNSITNKLLKFDLNKFNTSGF
jgi:hypothetical protein